MDSGSSCCIVSKEIYERIKRYAKGKLKPLKKPPLSITGEELKIIGSCNFIVKIEILQEIGVSENHDRRTR